MFPAQDLRSLELIIAATCWRSWWREKVGVEMGQLITRDGSDAPADSPPCFLSSARSEHFLFLSVS